MVNDHPFGQIGVPSRAVAHFQDKLLAFHVGGKNPGKMMAGERQQLIAAGFQQTREFTHPTQHLPFQRIEIGRCTAIVQVIAARHDGKVFGIGGDVTRRIVEIRNAQYMGELVDKNADCRHRRSSIAAELRRTGIFQDPDIVVVARNPEALVGPDRIDSAAFFFIVTGKIKEDVIHVTVFVEVVSGKVYRIVQNLAGFFQRFIGMGIIIAAIITVFPGNLDRTINIVNRRELSGGVVDVIVPDRTGCAVFAVARLIEHPVESLARIRDGERKVVEFNQEDQKVLFAEGDPAPGGSAPGFIDLTASLLTRSFLAVENHPGGRPVEALLVLFDQTTVVCGPMVEFVAVIHQRNDTSVRLNILKGSLGRPIGPGESCCQKQTNNHCQCSLHRLTFLQ